MSVYKAPKSGGAGSRTVCCWRGRLIKTCPKSGWDILQKSAVKNVMSCHVRTEANKPKKHSKLSSKIMKTLRTFVGCDCYLLIGTQMPTDGGIHGARKHCTKLGLHTVPSKHKVLCKIMQQSESQSHIIAINLRTHLGLMLYTTGYGSAEEIPSACLHQGGSTTSYHCAVS